MQWSVDINLAIPTAKTFLSGCIPIIGEWLADTLDSSGSSPTSSASVKFLYANQQDANKFIFKGNFL
jgi:hypothetical protein